MMYYVFVFFSYLETSVLCAIASSLEMVRVSLFFFKTIIFMKSKKQELDHLLC